MGRLPGMDENSIIRDLLVRLSAPSERTGGRGRCYCRVCLISRTLRRRGGKGGLAEVLKGLKHG